MTQTCHHTLRHRFTTFSTTTTTKKLVQWDPWQMKHQYYELLISVFDWMHPHVRGINQICTWTCTCSNIRYQNAPIGKKFISKKSKTFIYILNWMFFNGMELLPMYSSDIIYRIFPVLSSFMTYHRIVTRLIRRVPVVEQELPTLPEHLSSPLVFSGVRVTRSLVLCVCFVDRCLSFCTFFCHCVVCSSSIYRFWLPLWYLQTLRCRFRPSCLF